MQAHACTGLACVHEAYIPVMKHVEQVRARIGNLCGLISFMGLERGHEFLGGTNTMGSTAVASVALKEIRAAVVELVHRQRLCTEAQAHEYCWWQGKGARPCKEDDRRVAARKLWHRPVVQVRFFCPCVRGHCHSWYQMLSCKPESAVKRQMAGGLRLILFTTKVM